MKIVLYIVGILLILSSCTQTSQEKAEITIKEWMQKNLKDPNSYESISFSKLDSTNISVIQERLISESYPELIKLYAKNASSDSLSVCLTLESIEKAKKYGLYKGEYKEYLDNSVFREQESYENNKGSLERNIRERDSIINNKEFYAYTMIHRYRAKNSFGSLDFGEVIFYLNTNLDRIIDTKTIK